MIKYGNKIRLTDLAKELKVSSSAINQHLHNRSGLSEGAEKWSSGRTNELLLSIDSVLKFLSWLKMKRKKVTIEDIVRVEKELKQ